ncbi:MAG TPA: serine/threonine protein kinase [Archangium sp.]|uniref:serine/threonine protein kinase n=1 Tax=Archangium sp. TaxID=1872627 RepID=UPI002E2F6E3A|nr:serine/threonine protein kinase [Archangium sp.]HEX5751253.1 serine/threonine protein kinase [Archangium sp.]
MSPRRSLHLPALGALAVLFTACSGVRLRPDGTPEPQDCPREALDAMARLGIHPKDSLTVLVDERWGERGVTRLEEGPVVGYLDSSHEQLPERTRLFGQVWTAGEMVTVWYYEAEVPGGSRMPFCAEVDDSGGQVKDPSSPRGVAIIQDNVANAKVVARYGEIDPSRPKGRLFIYGDVDELPPDVRDSLKK